MSSRLNELDKYKFEYNLNIISPPLSYLNQANIDRFAIALFVQIPYPLLRYWGTIVDEKDVDYVELLNSWIPRRWFQVSRGSGFRIQGRIRREVCSVTNRYRQVKHTKKKRELDDKKLSLSILVSELVCIKDMEDSLEKANQLLLEWRQRYSELEEEKICLAQEMVQALEKKDHELERLNEELSNYIEKVSSMEKEPTTHFNGKPINQLSKRQTARRVKELQGKAEVALWFLETYGLKLSCLKLKELDSNKTHNLDYPTEDATEKDQETIEQILFLLDKFCASDELYHELTLAYDDLPRSYLIKQKRSELNNLCHIQRVPGNFPGAYISFSDILIEHTRDLLKIDPNQFENEPVKVKISADGARMSRTTNFMIMSFAILQTGDYVMSSKGNRTIAVVNGPEVYNTLATSFCEVICDINRVIKEAKIVVDGKDIAVKMFLGGDYKFLLMSMGLKGATSDYACIWCKIHKLQRWDMSKDLNFYNTGDMKRSLKDIKENKGTFSCIQPPLFDMDINNVILDELHLMLRVSDRLTENLITEVMQRDSESDFLKKPKEPKGVYLKSLLAVINSLGISFAIWEKSNADGKGSGVYDWTSLMGADKKKLMCLLPDKLESSHVLFPETKHDVVKLWKDFFCLYQLINNKTSDNPSLFLDVFSSARKFINLFCSLSTSRNGYTNARVTPYMHALAYHVPVFVRDHSSFKQFTGQGVEKNNDDAKKIFFQKSNKWDAARDILQHESRQHELKHHERSKRKYEKKDDDYWGKGIVESRKKRMHSTRNDVVSGSQELEESDLLLQVETGKAYEEMTVKQLKEEIKSKGLKVKGVAKMKKIQLIEVLKS